MLTEISKHDSAGASNMLAALEQRFEFGRALSNALDLVRKTPQDSVYLGEHVDFLKPHQPLAVTSRSNVHCDPVTPLPCMPDALTSTKHVWHGMPANLDS